IGAHLAEEDRVFPNANIEYFQAARDKETVLVIGFSTSSDTYKQVIINGFGATNHVWRIVWQTNRATGLQGVGNITHQEFLAIHHQIDTVQFRLNRGWQAVSKRVQRFNVVFQVDNGFQAVDRLAAVNWTHNNLRTRQNHTSGRTYRHFVAALQIGSFRADAEAGQINVVTGHNRT